MTALRSIHVVPYVPPRGCSVAARAHFLGVGRSRLVQLERFGDDDVCAFESARNERDLPTLVVVAMVRGRSCAEVANVLSACIGFAIVAGVGARLEPALLAQVQAALRLATSSSPDRAFVNEMRLKLVALRSRAELVQIVVELLDLVGRYARVGAGGIAERCADRLVSQLNTPLAFELDACLELVDATLGPALPVEAAG